MQSVSRLTNRCTRAAVATGRFLLRSENLTSTELPTVVTSNAEEPYGNSRCKSVLFNRNVLHARDTNRLRM